jgi:hypothetical protein
MNIQQLTNLAKKVVCVFVFIAVTSMVSGCASLGSSSASSAISIGMSKQSVVSVVGSGNVALAKKRTQTTTNGVKEVWILYKGPLGWGWTENALDKQVIIEFENGVVSSIIE